MYNDMNNVKIGFSISLSLSLRKCLVRPLAFWENVWGWKVPRTRTAECVPWQNVAERPVDGCA